MEQKTISQLTLFADIAQAKPSTKKAKASKTYKTSKATVRNAVIECAVEAVRVADIFATAPSGRRAYHNDHALRLLRTALTSTDMKMSDLLEVLLTEVRKDEAKVA